MRAHEKAIEGDVYYGMVAGRKAWRLHNPAAGPDKTWNKPLHFVISVTVDGDRVALRVVSAQAGVLDECTLLGGKRR